MNKNQFRAFAGKGFESAMYRFLTRLTARDGLAKTLAGAGDACYRAREARPIVRVDDWEDGIDRP